MVTVTTDPNGRNSVVTENQIKHLQAIHATMSIVDMVGITDKNDSNQNAAIIPVSSTAEIRFCSTNFSVQTLQARML